jgi:hypothetical protein
MLTEEKAKKICDSLLVVLNTTIKNYFAFLERHMLIFLFVVFFLSLGLRLIFTDYISVLRLSQLVYTLKALEITNGNFVPVETQLLGWPIVLSSFLYFIKSQSLFQNMFYVKIISSFIGAFMVFPMYFFASRLLNKKNTIISLLLFLFYPSLILLSGSVSADSIFIITMLFSIFFMYKSLVSRKWIIVSLIFSAFAVIIKQNGFFVAAAVSLSFVVLNAKTLKKDIIYLFIGLFDFLIIYAPFHLNRQMEFGSAFYYGLNSNYLAETPAEQSSPNMRGPSLFVYLKTHSLYEIFDRFVIRGFLSILFRYLHNIHPFEYSGIVSPFLIFFMAVGFFNTLLNKKYLPLLITLFIFILGISLVYRMFALERYLYPTIPILLIYAAIGTDTILMKNRYPYALVFLFIILFITFSIATPLTTLKQEPTTIPIWAKWAASNIHGKIGLYNGGDLIVMNLPDVSVAGGGEHSMYASESNLTYERFGSFENLDSAILYFKNKGFTHLAIDDAALEYRPYLNEIKFKKYENLFIPIYSSYGKGKWAMDIYLINWEKYHSN